MIDIHVHILPEMDDGARDREDALAMADMAYSSGVNRLVALCHANFPGQDREHLLTRYWQKFEELKEQLRKERIPLEIIPGMELWSDGNLPKLLKEGRLLTLNGSRNPLIEFDFEIPAYRIYEDVDLLLEAGYTPVIAHPERYRCVSQEIWHVFEWQQMGAAIQINKGSILGRFGERIQKNADLLLKHRIASVVASDAHSAEFRTTDMREIVEVLGEYYGSASVEILLEENPRRIIQSEEVLDIMPIPF